MSRVRIKVFILCKVLLIDDNPVQLSVREAVLRDAGFEVCIARSATAALALLRTDPISGRIGTIVTDHYMPGVSGAEFVKQLRAVDFDVPVIVISGMPGVEDQYAGLNVIFRQKPCPPQELISLVRDALPQAA